MNMKDPAQRDMCISFWYLDMAQVVENLELRTGHKFTPVAKVKASPIEILEEQLAFMKKFEIETEKLRRQQSVKNATPAKKAEQDAAANP